MRKKLVIKGKPIRRAERHSGFTSGLFWHFTGGPKIDASKMYDREDFLKKSRKSNSEATSILLDILSTTKLKATCKESLFPGTPVDLKTEPFCCVTDIPFRRLHLHGAYYGNVAIGFRSDPIYELFYPIRYDNSSDDAFESVLQTILELEEEMEKKECASIQEHINDLITEVLFNTGLCKRTTFSTDFNKSFYYEREWRCFDDFEFKPEDIGVLIVSDRKIKGKDESFYDRVIDSDLYKADYSHVPVIPWRLIREL